MVREPTPLHRRLWVVVAAALLPTAVLSAIALGFLLRAQQAEVSRATIDTTRALVGAVDRELNSTIAVAETLAASDALDNGDLAAFHEEARRVANFHPQWVTIALSDTHGNQLLNVLEPLDASLPRLSYRNSFQRVVATLRPTIGNLGFGVGSRPGFAVCAPVVRDAELSYVLTVVVSPDSMLDVIRKQRVSDAEVVSILDAHGSLVARSRQHEQLLGQPASHSLRELMADRNEGWGPSLTLDGQAVYAAFSRSQASGWSVAVGVPASDIDAALNQSLLTMGLGAVLSVLIGILASMSMARLITVPIGLLRRAAHAVGRGEVPEVDTMHITEINDVAHALVGAARARSQAETSRQELLERERVARTAAEDANRGKDEFLAMLGHELRNPLSAISNAIRVIDAVSVAPTPEPQQRAQRVIRRQVDHLARLVDDLLDVARVDGGKVTLEQRKMDLGQSAKHSIATLASAGYLGKHEITVDAQTVWIRGDSTRIEQVITNLVGNAVKYTPVGGHVRVSVRQEDDWAVVEVSDDGVGIEPDLLPYVFELFKQGERALDRSQGGLGIGLTLVRRLVELHHGTVSAQSAGEGEGSTFTVRLPVAAAGEMSVPSERSMPSGACRVLIVEDNEDAREMLRALLEMRGHAVAVASDGPQGVERALQDRPQVAFVDIGLPGFDGFEVARRVRTELTKDETLLVALSGYGSATDRQRSREAGFDLHLIKPVASDALNEVLEDALQSVSEPCT